MLINEESRNKFIEETNKKRDKFLQTLGDMPLSSFTVNELHSLVALVDPEWYIESKLTNVDFYILGKKLKQLENERNNNG